MNARTRTTLTAALLTAVAVVVLVRAIGRPRAEGAGGVADAGGAAAQVEAPPAGDAAEPGAATGGALPRTAADGPVRNADPVPAGALARIRGRVTAREDGAPIAGAEIVAGAHRELARTRTDPDGHYEMVFTDGVPVTVFASAPGRTGAGESLPWAEHGRSRRLADVRASPDDLALDFALARSAMLAVTVTWDGGAPCAGARLRLRAADTGGLVDWLARPIEGGEARTDERGRAAFASLPAGALVLAVEPPDLGPWEERALVLAPGADETRAVVLSAPATLALEVRGLEPWLGGGHGGEVAARPEGGGRARGVSLRAWEGRIDGLHQGLSYRLEARIDGYEPARLAESVVLASPRESRAVDLPELVPTGAPDARAPAWAFGWSLVDGDGTAWTAERLERAGHDPFDVRLAARTAEDVVRARPGYELAGGSDPYRGSGQARGAAPAAVEMRLGDAVARAGGVGPGDRATLVLPDDGGPPTHRVAFVGRLPGGREAAVLRAIVRPLAGGAPRRARIDTGPASFGSVAWLPDGEYELVAWTHDHPSAAARFRVDGGDARVDVDFGPPAVLAGRVEPPPGGRTVVALVPAAAGGLAFAGPGAVAVRPDGGFHVDGIAPGAWSLCVQRYDLAGGRHAAWSRPVAVEPGLTEVVVACEPSDLAVEVVLDLEGTDSAWVRLADAEDRSLFAGPARDGDRVRLARPPAVAHLVPRFREDDAAGWDSGSLVTVAAPAPTGGVVALAARFPAR